MRRKIQRLATLLCIAVGSFTSEAHEISGTVYDHAGNVVPNAKVWLIQERIPKAAVSDAQGAFSFDAVATGPVAVFAYREGHALGAVGGQVIDDTEITFNLEEPDSIRLRTIDTDYKPVRGARLKKLVLNETVDLFMEDVVPLGFPSIRSDDNGYLTIPALAKNSFVGITVSHRDHADAALLALPVGIELDMPMLDSVTVRGRVTDESGQGVERARVSIFRLGPAGVFEFSQNLTDPEGFFAGNVPPEAYYVAVRHPDFAMPEPMSVNLRRGVQEETLHLALPTPHRVEGVAVNISGEPVPFVKLAYRSGDWVYAEAISDQQGHFTLLVSSGKGVLHVTPPERMMTVKYPEIPFQVEDEPLIRLGEIELQALPEIAGSVIAKEEIALDKVLISSLNIDPPIWTTASTDGSFTIPLDRMIEGPLRFRAEHAARFLRREFKINLHDLNEVEVTLRGYRPKFEMDDRYSPNDLKHMLDKPAPEIACDAWFNLPPDQESLSLSDLRGKVVVLTLWGGFAGEGATRNRMNELNAVYELLKDADDVALIAVHDASIEPVEVWDFVEDFGIQYPVGCDADPFLTFDIYNTNTIPQTVLVDKEGVLRYYKVEDDLLDLIKDLRRR